MLTIVLSHTNPSTTAELCQLHVHAKPLQSKLNTHTIADPCTVTLLGSERSRPWIKESQWVTDRKPLEALMHNACSEAILTANADGEHVLEGLKANFFAVVWNENRNRWELHTASSGLDAQPGVLNGTVRDWICEHCEAHLGLPVVQRHPRISEAKAYWDEAFITSAIRISQPVESVVRPLRGNNQNVDEVEPVVER
jgi:branched-subunit amino acid aminotransferase/4-amino-4-deoxychorismate lyase